MRIVHVLNSLTVGGIEKVVVDICNHTATNENEVYIITLSDRDLTLHSKLNANIKVFSLPFINFSFLGLLMFWLFGIPKLIKILNEIKPDIVHSHLYYHYLFFLSLGLKFSNLKAIHLRTVHTAGLFYSSKTLLNRFRCQVEKYAFKVYPTRLISISGEIFENNLRLFSGWVLDNRLISNGIDLFKFSKSNYKGVSKRDFGLEDNNIVVSYVSRLDNGKNHRCLLEAWVQVIKEFPTSSLCLAGDGDLKVELMNYSESLGIGNKVVFLGMIDDVASLLSVTDIAVFPSQFEGFPISLIEKMSMELPVVVSDIDVFKEVITDFDNGILCSVNNSKSYACNLLTLIKDEELRMKIGKNAKEKAKSYDIKKITNDTIRFYREALSQ